MLNKTILEKYPKTTKFSVSATTRKARSSEVDGIDYHFFSNQKFSEHIKEGKFYEYEEVHVTHDCLVCPGSLYKWQ